MAVTNDPSSNSDDPTGCPRLVEYCLGNVTPEQRARLDDADVPTREADCLDHCGTCYRSNFVIRDGEVVDDEEHIRRLLGE